MLEIIYTILRVYPTTWWLWAAAILLVFNVLLANLAPILLMPLFNKFVPLGDEHAELADRLIQLARRSGTYVRGVFKFDMSRRTKQANAGLTGLGKTRRIIIGDTLLNEFTSAEIETVMAHELGHQVNKDIPLGIIIRQPHHSGRLIFSLSGIELGCEGARVFRCGRYCCLSLIFNRAGMYTDCLRCRWRMDFLAGVNAGQMNMPYL